MIKTKDFNNLPKAILDQYVLKPGEVKIFVLEDRFKRYEKGKEVWPQSVPIPMTGIHIDAKGTVYPIAAINDALGNFIPVHLRSFTRKGGGRLVLKGGTRLASLLYPYMMLLNENASNPTRDKTVAPVFRLYDEEAEAKEMITKAKTEMGILSQLIALKDPKAKTIALALGLANPADSGTVAKMKLLEEANKSPEKIKAAMKDKNVEVKALVAKVAAAGDILFDGEHVLWADSGTPIIKAGIRNWKEKLAEKAAKDKELNAALQAVESKRTSGATKSAPLNPPTQGNAGTGNNPPQK